MNVRDMHQRTTRLPGGDRLFDRLIARIVPYTGTVRPRVLELRPGHARVAMRDRRRVRNHLGSVHAIAIANIAEFASGLALTYSMGDDIRAILVGLELEYVKKARGTLVAEANLALPEVTGPHELAVASEVRDGDGDTVARATAHWLLDRVA